MGEQEPEVAVGSTAAEVERRQEFLELFRRCPIPDSERLANLGLFVKRQDMARWLFLHELYREALDVHGVVMEFGVRWGQNLALFEAFRGIYEPHNYNRTIVGFDTFTGFPAVSAEDGHDPVVHAGAYPVTEGYADYLDRVLAYHEQESPIAHKKKYELVVGDVTVTAPDYLRHHPETVVALAYFDLDLYQPTRVCLEAIRPHLTRGSVLGFDELNTPQFPGETRALAEVLGLDRVRLHRRPYSPLQSFLVIE